MFKIISFCYDITEWLVSSITAKRTGSTSPCLPFSCLLCGYSVLQAVSRSMVKGILNFSVHLGSWVSSMLQKTISSPLHADV